MQKSTDALRKLAAVPSASSRTGADRHPTANLSPRGSNCRPTDSPQGARTTAFVTTKTSKTNKTNRQTRTTEFVMNPTPRDRRTSQNDYGNARSTQQPPFQPLAMMMGRGRGPEASLKSSSLLPLSTIGNGAEERPRPTRVACYQRGRASDPRHYCRIDQTTVRR